MAEAIDPKILTLNQKFGWIILRPFLKFFTRYSFCVDCDIRDLKRPFIITSNHTSHIDSPLFGTVLPFGCGVYPVYFIAIDRFWTTMSFRGKFLRLFGAFRAYKKEGLDKSLAIPQKILKDGYSLLFFPQSHRRPYFDVNEGRQGAAILALKTKIPILPVAICGISNFSWKDFFGRKYRIKVKIGQPYFLHEKLSSQNAAEDVQEGTKIIMLEIKKLLESY
ncbi:MAG: hypothetical protein A2174_01245 [Candidatus Portnoybacteria bacterium RBG_13_41_18]|uniref:Phospholipid/glycerol acyltransferase domain-containing protein n=1 Tax=Candidatus Portnoybacteria bacterium RBG_13_41_18 TaxID=1801991 RepID=A0A1G2F5X5_9BACT|nr:MAG: hypothetical protein A2174_01245 [Candidatus Portnoybacteria bacterium RBG_13_41_18]